MTSHRAIVPGTLSYTRLLLLLIAWIVCQPLVAQVIPVGSSGTATSKPELDQLASDYEAQESAIDAEIEPQLKAARDGYTAQLKELINKFNQAKRPEEADKVRSESKRFAERGTNSEPSKAVPAEVRTAWTGLLRATVAASQSVALKRNAVRSKFIQGLTALEQGYRTKNDGEGTALARRARATVAIRTAIETNRLAATDIAGKGHGWQEVAKEGGYVVGFETGKGGWFQFAVLGDLRPIFATARGNRDGERRGKSGGDRVLAKEGYAVGGLYVRSGEVVNCVQIIFMRLNPNGTSLNAQDFYVTDWLGGEGGSKPKEISGRGRLIVGVTGATGDVVDSIGLIYLK